MPGLSNIISIQSSRVIIGGGSSYEPEVLAYIAAGSITDQTEIDAVEQFVLDLKGLGSTTNNTDVFSDMVALYITSPTSLDSSEVNLKTGLQTGTFYNPTHTSIGMYANGTTSYFDYGFNLYEEFYPIDIYNYGITAVTSRNFVKNNFTAGYITKNYTGDGGASTTGMQWQTSNRRLGVVNSSSSSTYAGSTADDIHTFVTRGQTEMVFRVSNGETASQVFNQTISTIQALLPPGRGVFGNNFIGQASWYYTANSGYINQYGESWGNLWSIHKGLSDNQIVDFHAAIAKLNNNIVTGGRRLPQII